MGSSDRAARFAPFAIRDAGIAALAAGLLALEAATAGAASVALGVAAGVALAVAGFLIHEWGHWLGARLSGARVEAPARVTAVFLFAFDTARSTRRQFLWMSVGGYLATLVALGLLLAVVDATRPSGWTALGLAGLGAIVTFALEVPTTVRVARGGALPTGGVYAGEP